MELKKLDVPTSSITEVKKSPMDVFDQARKAETGVYIFNREKVAGVMLTKDQYEKLLEEVKKHDEDDLLVNNKMEEVSDQLKNLFPAGSITSAHLLDEKMVELGFHTKRSSGGIVNMVIEMNETGKILYRSHKRRDGSRFIAEVIGEQDPQSQLFEKMIIKKIHLSEE